MDPGCKFLRKGMNGEYRFKRVKVPGEERYKDEPDKNAVSHVCEALQYVALHINGPRESGRKAKVVRPPKYVAPTAAGY